MKQCKEHKAPLFSESIAVPFGDYIEKVVVNLEKTLQGALELHHSLYPETRPSEIYLKRVLRNATTHSLQAALNAKILKEFGKRVGEKGIPCTSDELKELFDNASGFSVDEGIAMIALYANHHGLKNEDFDLLAAESLHVEIAVDREFNKAEFRSIELKQFRGVSQPLGIGYSTKNLELLGTRAYKKTSAAAVPEWVIIILTLGLPYLFKKLCGEDEELDEEKRRKLKKLRERLKKNLKDWEREVEKLENDIENLDKGIDELDDEVDDLEDEIDDLDDDIDDEDDPEKKKQLRKDRRKKRQEKRKKEKEKKNKEKEKKNKEKELEEKKNSLKNAKDAVDELDDILD